MDALKDFLMKKAEEYIDEQLDKLTENKNEPDEDKADLVQAPGLSDDIQIERVVCTNGLDIRGWPLLYPLRVALVGERLILDQELTAHATPVGPAGDLAVGNPWVFVNINGIWHGCTFEWFRKGATDRAKRSVAGDHMKYFRLWPVSWRPTPGEQYGFCVTTIARGNGPYNGQERTAIRLLTWE